MARKSITRTSFILGVLSKLTEMREGACERIQGSINVIQEQPIGLSVGWADVICSPYREVDACLVTAGSHHLNQIDRAIARFHAGEYGVCEECGLEISLERLQAIPYTTLCIKCAHAQPATD